MDKLSQLRSKGYIVHDAQRISGFFDEFRFLSNMYKCNFIYNGVQYSSSEQAYVAAKCLKLHDFDTVLRTDDPAKCKSLGRNVALIPCWNHVKLNIMRNILVEKFSVLELREKLLATNDKYLEEANYWNDRFWGTFYSNGQNNLGLLLMEIRRSFGKRSS